MLSNIVTQCHRYEFRRLPHSAVCHTLFNIVGSLKWPLRCNLSYDQYLDWCFFVSCFFLRAHFKLPLSDIIANLVFLMLSCFLSSSLSSYRASDYDIFLASHCVVCCSQGHHHCCDRQPSASDPDRCHRCCFLLQVCDQKEMYRHVRCHLLKLSNRTKTKTKTTNKNSDYFGPLSVTQNPLFNNT